MLDKCYKCFKMLQNALLVIPYLPRILVCEGGGGAFTDQSAVLDFVPSIFDCTLPASAHRASAHPATAHPAACAHPASAHHASALTTCLSSPPCLSLRCPFLLLLLYIPPCLCPPCLCRPVLTFALSLHAVFELFVYEVLGVALAVSNEC
jgi:hypothetical protein